MIWSSRPNGHRFANIYSITLSSQSIDSVAKHRSVGHARLIGVGPYSGLSSATASNEYPGIAQYFDIVLDHLVARAARQLVHEGAPGVVSFVWSNSVVKTRLLP